MKKKKSSLLANSFSKTVAIILTASLCICALITPVTFGVVKKFIIPQIMGRHEVSALRFTRLPEDAEFLSFEIYYDGGSATWAVSELQFSSHESEEYLLHFFNISDNDFRYGEPQLWTIGQNDAGRTIYKLVLYSTEPIET